VYDVGKLGEPLHIDVLEVNPAILIPHYDEGTSTVFLTGRVRHLSLPSSVVRYSFIV
jgi:hypothetical protein